MVLVWEHVHEYRKNCPQSSWTFFSFLSQSVDITAEFLTWTIINRKWINKKEFLLLCKITSPHIGWVTSNAHGCPTMPNRIFILLFPTQVSLVNFPQRISLQKSRQSRRLLGQTDNVCIRRKITQSTIKTTKEAAESTNMSYSLKIPFNRESKWIKERLCYSFSLRI